MQNQQELGGAQALLLLGTKDAKPDENPEASPVPAKPDAQAEISLEKPHLENDEPDFMEKANQLLNDAVEAAVMRYVGGTLETGDELHGDAHFAENTEPEHELEHFSHRRHKITPEDLMSEYQWDKFLEEEVAAGFERATPKKRRRKSLGGDEIDPELDDLEPASEHDKLVHAAILGAGELAKQLTLPPSAHGRLQQQISLLQDRRVPGVSEGAVPSAISHLAQAASTLSDSEPSRKRSHKKPAISPHDSNDKLNFSSVEELVGQASRDSCLWFNSQQNTMLSGPRLFSPEEIDIVDNYIQAYCRLHNLTRLDICRRVWSTDRPKDKFWESLAKCFPYRSKASVYKHVRRQYHVFDFRAKWTPEDDALLRRLAEGSSTNWKKIGESMNRMPEDCRDRWRNYVKCGDNRASNKWSEAEEQSLKNVVMEMITSESENDKPIQINWTLVSERMNGVRSRIQCRYKWNKLLRRESISRVAMMDAQTRLWLLNRVAETNTADPAAIDWDYIMDIFHEEHKGKAKMMWTTEDFRVAFERMKSTVRDHKNLPLQSLVAKLIEAIYLETISGDASIPGKNPPKALAAFDELRPKTVTLRQVAEQEAASAANAAVAAVASGVSELDARHQEYSLWR